MKIRIHQDPSRLSENAHLLCYFHFDSLRRTFLFASFLGISNAVHSIIFRRPRSCLILRQNPRKLSISFLAGS